MIELASAADVATTEWGLMRGAEEANPLMRDRLIRITSKTAVTAGFVALHRHFDHRGERRKAKAVVIVACVVWGGVAAWNAAQQ